VSQLILIPIVCSLDENRILPPVELPFGKKRIPAAYVDLRSLVEPLIATLIPSPIRIGLTPLPDRMTRRERSTRTDTSLPRAIALERA